MYNLQFSIFCELFFVVGKNKMRMMNEVNNPLLYCSPKQQMFALKLNGEKHAEVRWSKLYNDVVQQRQIQNM